MSTIITERQVTQAPAPTAPRPEIMRTTSELSAADRRDHLLARLGYRRGEHRVRPGLYAIGAPTPQSPVMVTANYSLSFDALRSSLGGMDAYLLVLDTMGVNVWCAAGKGTFGTDELVRRVALTGLAGVVEHRTLILPQLGASGIAAHEVKRRSGFKVEYGPVRAEDLPAYMATRTATPEMRQVRFNLEDRAVLIPVELVHLALPTLVVALILGLLGGLIWGLAALSAVLAGTALFLLLLPWLPTREFSVKGLILGGVVALPFAAWSLAGGAGWAEWVRAAAFMLAMPAVTGYLALNLTGTTPITSPTGVRLEMHRYIRPMAVMFGLGVILTLVAIIAHLVGG